MSVVSREASASIKAGIDSMEANLDNLDSVGPIVSQSSSAMNESEDMSLRELNSMQMLNSSGRTMPSPMSGLGIVTTTEKYGNSVPSSPVRSPHRTPRGTSRNGSGSSSRSLTARSVGARGKLATPRSNTTPIRELDRMAIEAKAPPRFICPISGRVMRDPVILVTGTTCDRVALERRLAAGNKRCPVTNKNLRVPISMTPNTELRDTICAWARKNAPWMMDATGAFLLSEETGRYELQGSDKQYVCTPGAGTPNASRTPSRTPSRTESGKGSWVFTNGTKARPGSINMSATPGTLEAGRAGSIPWYANRGIASPRSSRKLSRGTSSRGGSRSPTKSGRMAQPGDWYSLAFLIIISVVYLSMFLYSLSLDDWKVAPMSENPWYGPSPQALVDAGATVMTLMSAPGNEWWRLFSSIFLPAGMIQMFICMLFLWLFGHPARKSLPLPQVSLAGVFILSSLVGSMLSANLNGKYVSCGAFSGVLSMIAVFCVDQMFSWPRNRLFNLKEWWLVALMMVIVVGGLFAISLFPLVDIWVSLGGFVGGMLMALIILPIPRVRSQALGSRRKLIWTQALSGVALLGIIVAASVGLAITPNLGESIDVLQDISCVEMSSSMNCTPYGFLSDGSCGLEWSHESSAVVVACQSADSSAFQYYTTNATFSDIGNEVVTQTECQRFCDGRSDSISVIAIPPASGSTAEDLMSELNGPTESTPESDAAQAPLSAPVVVPSPPLAVVSPPPKVASPPPAPSVNLNINVGTNTNPTTVDTQQANLFGGAGQASTETDPLPSMQVTSPTPSPTPVAPATTAPPTNTASTTNNDANVGTGNLWGRGSTPKPTTTPTTTNEPDEPVVALGVTDEIQTPVLTTTPSPSAMTQTIVEPQTTQPQLDPTSPAPLFG